MEDHRSSLLMDLLGAFGQFYPQKRARYVAALILALVLGSVQEC